MARKKRSREEQARRANLCLEFAQCWGLTDVRQGVALGRLLPIDYRIALAL